jgi:hypothetical protein
MAVEKCVSTMHKRFKGSMMTASQLQECVNYLRNTLIVDGVYKASVQITVEANDRGELKFYLCNAYTVGLLIGDNTIEYYDDGADTSCLFYRISIPIAEKA